MTFLYVLLGIILFFVVILSIPLHITVSYDDKIRLTVRYLFLKLRLLPVKEKPKKEKKPKEPKAEKEEQPKQPKEKKPNPILEMVKANGYDGMMTVLSNLMHILKIYGGKLFKSVVFDELYLYICVATGDAAATAIKYGQTCQRVYPIMGYICSNNIVKKYDIDVDSDFLANNSQGEFYFDAHLCVRKIINATIAMVIRLVFGVVITFIKGGKKQPAAGTSEDKKQTSANTMKG